MANPYSVRLQNIVTDGTNIFVTASVFDGLHTLPPMTSSFPAATTAAQINAYFQVVANNQPILSGSIAALVDTTIQGQ